MRTSFPPLALVIRCSLLVTAFVLGSSAAFAWGGTGHKVAVALAEANLSPKAKANIEKYLDGKSIVEFSSWMDEVRETPEYKYTTGWHSAPVDGRFYHNPGAKKDGDVITATIDSIRTLRNYQKRRADTVALHIKLLVHMIPDSHCPVHVGYASIPTQFNVVMNGKALLYHQVWDGTVVSAHKLSVKEWVQRLNRLTPEQVAKITKGSPDDWFHQTARDSLVIYTWAKSGEKFDGEKYDGFIKKTRPLVEAQLQKAGYRLAAVLNSLFGQ